MNLDELPVELTGAPYLAGLDGKLAAQKTAR